MELLKASKSSVAPEEFEDNDASLTPSGLLKKKQFAPDPDSGIKVQLEKPTQQVDDKKRITLSPPKPTIQKEKKISFDMGGKMKPKSSGKLFSRMGEKPEDSESEMFGSGDDIGTSSPSKLSLSPETLEKAIELDSKNKEMSLREPEASKVTLKRSNEVSAQDKGKPMLELKLNKNTGDDGTGRQAPMVNRPASIKKPTVKMPSKPVGLAKPPDITVPTRILMDARAAKDKQTAFIPPQAQKFNLQEMPGQSKEEGGDISGSSQG
jgi:hypothetical protein